MTALSLSGNDLTIDSLYELMQQAEQPTATPKLAVTDGGAKNIAKAENYLQHIIASGSTVYGVNTGFGFFAKTRINETQMTDLQERIIRSHAVGMGKPLPRALVMGIWGILLNSACRGHRGIRQQTIDYYITLLKHNVLAHVPERGSVGASGDLAPTAHAVLVGLGEGHCSVPDGDAFIDMPAKDALRKLGIEPLRLGPKEGLSLINGTQLSASMAVMLWREGRHLIQVANMAASMTLEAMRASHHILDPKLAAENRHESCGDIQRDMWQWIGGETRISKSHANCDRVQDPYSLRCAPQVHGAVLQEFLDAEPIITQELNATTDNPILFPDEDQVIHGGNFHAIYMGRVLDKLGSALTTLAAISERRTHMLMKQEKSGLPDFLIRDGGLNSGLMMTQTTSASLVNACQALSMPASVMSISTNNDQEDHVSMAPNAGLKALEILRLARQVLTIELMAAAQGLDLLAPLESSPALEGMKRAIREHVPFLEEDCYLADYMASLENAVAQESWLTRK